MDTKPVYLMCEVCKARRNLVQINATEYQGVILRVLCERDYTNYLREALQSLRNSLVSDKLKPENEED